MTAMRTRVYLKVFDKKTGKSQLPINYRFLLLSLIKEGMYRNDETLLSELYDAAPLPKKLTFALYMNSFKLVKETGMVEFEEGVLTISSSDTFLMSRLLSGLTTIKTYTYQNRFEVTITNIELGHTPVISGNLVHFKTMSSFLFENEEKKPVLIGDKNFTQTVNAYMNIRFTSLYERPLYEPLEFISHNLRIRVVKEKNHHTDGQELTYTTQFGDFVLRGHPEDLQLIYEDGFGKRASQGMGCLRV